MKDLRRTADAGDIQITTAMIWTMLSLQQTGFLPVSTVLFVIIQFLHKIIATTKSNVHKVLVMANFHNTVNSDTRTIKLASYILKFNMQW